MAPAAAVCFSDLPTEALDKIARRVGPLDNFHCSAVCRSWRRAPRATRLGGLDEPHRPHSIFLHKDWCRSVAVEVTPIHHCEGARGIKTVVSDGDLLHGYMCTTIIGCSYGWIVAVYHHDDTKEICLIDPFTDSSRSTYKQQEELKTELCSKRKAMFTKAALAPGRRLGTFALMLIHSGGQGLSFLKPGSKTWRMVRTPKGTQYIDVVLHKGSFCTLSSFGEVNAWVPDGGGGMKTRRLTDKRPEQLVWAVLAESASHDGLVMVSTMEKPLYMDYRKHYQVSRCDERGRRWHPVKDLGETAILAGGQCSLCISTRGASGGGGAPISNYIYFASYWNKQDIYTMEKYLTENPKNIICTATKSSTVNASDPAHGYNSAVPQPNDLNNSVRSLSESELKDGWVSSSAKRNSSPFQQDDSHCGKKKRYLGPGLPDDIWRHIHFLLPMQDAARAACVSLSSWRCYPNLIFTNQTMCSKEKLLKETAGSNVIADYNNNIGRVLTNHSGTGVRKFKLEYHHPYVAKSYNQLRSWLKFAITPGIEELDLTLLWKKQATTFNFPCKLLSERCQESIRDLRLFNCAFLHKFELGLRNLKILHLCKVRIKEDELGCLLSSSVALEHLKLMYFDDIMRLEIPCMMQKLSVLEVIECSSLQVIERKAPNISRCEIVGNEVQLSLGESLKLKNLMLYLSRAISYAIDNLPSCVPNLETLTIYSSYETVNAPLVSSKFLHLKHLSIRIFGWNFHRDYDYLSLVSFFDASPCLEKFVLYVKRQLKYDSFEGDPSSLRRMPEHRHGKLKRVNITGFCPQKSMIELACHILENATSLKHLTLDASPVNGRCSGNVTHRKCPPMEAAYIRQAHKTILAVRTYIQGKVPRRVKLNVLEPCSRCHAL